MAMRLYNAVISNRMRNLRNIKILRFLIVLTAVIFIIFIYASYSTNQTLLPPPMRTLGLISYPPINTLNNKSSDYDTAMSASVVSHKNNHSVNSEHRGDRSSHNHTHNYSDNLKDGIKSRSGSDLIFVKKAVLHREPTIDENANDNGLFSDDVPDDSTFANNNNNNDAQQFEEYLQTIANSLGNVNQSNGNGVPISPSNNAEQRPNPSNIAKANEKLQQNGIIDNCSNNNNNLNKIPESDVLIPTSNLQKFIENADKILKNYTAQPPIGREGTDTILVQPETFTKLNEMDQAQIDKRVYQGDQQAESEQALPPSMIIKMKGLAPPMSVKKAEAPALILSQNGTSSAKSTVKPTASSARPMSPSAVRAVKVAISTPKLPVDPSQGIPTHQIYESGHILEEIELDQLCPKNGTGLKLLILITSALEHSDARLAIRQSWGHYTERRDVSIAFVLGRTANQNLNKDLSEENSIYGDLIRGHYIDSYNNLTLKTISSLEWVDQHCAKAKFILKTDDDMFINVSKLLLFLDNHAKDKKTIYGRLAKKWKPIRNKKSKYYVSPGQFGAAVFPPFTTGPAYVMTRDVIHDVYEQALRQVYFKLEDVFTTGIVAQQLGIKRVHINDFLNRRIPFNSCNIRKAISVHMIKPNEQFDLWRKLLDQTIKCK
uniref:Galectin domain-containing protein n=1 Tax=Glossina brevipalpis TaxID=37001 RepID=A0A1A9W437_9MUSC